ncbi:MULTISPECIES: hypothetical protein [Mumia]|uniref:hypothetical protein n=1 Tax=Mumia TaxID=1546255 RepID=UPI001420D30D|nr:MULTISPECIES: hypothetical protein [unclassified Mumia]QMW67430.1 hypothetical protein H4N58_05885 [Mumia sp. ZJ1417]
MSPLLVAVVLLNALAAASVLFALTEANKGVAISELAVFLTAAVAMIAISILLVTGSMIS